MKLYRARQDETELTAIWPHIEFFVQRIAEHSDGDIPPAALFASIAHGENQLWLVVDEARPERDRVRAIVITQINGSMSGERAARIVACAGNGRKEWLQLVIDELIKWSKGEGCKVLQGTMRRGWLPDLAKTNPPFRITGYMMEVEI